MSALMDHANRELDRLDIPEDVKVNIRLILSVYEAYGYFGRTQYEVSEKIMSLLKFKNLSPLTDDPNEWEQIGDVLWKNKRHGNAFSQNGGKTFYYVGGSTGFANPWPQHVSYPHNLEKDND